ncbi:MAG: RagB/SusD family nutrient uptake outer membrane protein [Tannerella sp.]|jgi:hypothetical protein|nr:RagB/SusD family nutrient uptake outer membrane protein [Tannerella sp.]
MQKYIIKLMSLVAVIALVSCNDNDLEIPQKGVIPVDETYANADDKIAGQLIGEVYATAKYLITGDWGIHYIATTTVKVADFWPGGSDANDGGDYQQMAKMIDNAENNAYKDMYQCFYNIIYKCNMIVDKLNDGSTERKRVIAEAKAWRAWSMMRLTQLWGSAPLVDHVLDGINYSFTPGNTPPEESWSWIMQQFDEAAADLPSKGGLGGQRQIGGRWTADACYAYKGQGYMWQNDYEKAKIELAKVINSGKYALWTKTATMGASSYGNNIEQYKANKTNPGMQWLDGSESYEYLTLFRAEADFCDEYLLEIDTDGDANTISNTEPFWFWAYMGWRQDQMYAPGNSNQNDGWGFINPTRAFGTAFCKHDRNSVRRRMSIATFDEVYYDFPYLDSSVRGIMDGKKLFSNQGYFRMKYYNFVDDLDEGRYASGQTHGNRTNFPLLRYANILLYYAEAVCMSGSEGTANISGLEALNMVRTRAGITAAPALNMDNSDYGIKAERRFELCMEDCDRYVDLIRWGDYKNFIQDTSDNGVGDYWGAMYAWLGGLKNPNAPRPTDPWDLSNYDISYDQMQGKGAWTDKLLLWPFPYAETTANPNLTQNLGW